MSRQSWILPGLASPSPDAASGSSKATLGLYFNTVLFIPQHSVFRPSFAAMKIAPSISTFLFVGFSLLPQGVDSFKVVENFLGKSKIAEVQNAVHCKDKNDYDSDTSDGGFTFLKQDILSRIHKTALLQRNQGLFFKPSTDTQQQLVPTRVIRDTTRSHQDRFRDDTHGLVEDDVVFIFLNTNTDATFVHGNDSTAVAAGTMVRFRGDVPHHTVVNKGFVRLVGPFHAASLKPVGSTCSFTFGNCDACSQSCCNAIPECVFDSTEDDCIDNPVCSSTNCPACDVSSNMCDQTPNCEVVLDSGKNSFCRPSCGNGLEGCRQCANTVQCGEQPMCFVDSSLACQAACSMDEIPEEFVAACSELTICPEPSMQPSESPSDDDIDTCPFSFNIFAWIFCLIRRFFSSI